MVSRAAYAIAWKMFLWWLRSQRGGLTRAGHPSGAHQGRQKARPGLLIGRTLFSGDQVWDEEPGTLFLLPHCRDPGHGDAWACLPSIGLRTEDAIQHVLLVGGR